MKTSVAEFEIIMDPTNRWLVWDVQKQEPAMWAGSLSVWDTREEAEMALKMLATQKHHPVPMSRVA